MATTFVIRIADREREYARQAAAAAWRELDRLEGELSRFIDSSDIARVNRLASGQSTTIGDDALQCLLQAAEISAITGRAFDPAYASLRDPEAGDDAPLFALDPDAHTLTSLTPRLRLDLGAVGKGYALDVMARVLGDWEIDAALLESGRSTVLALAAPAGAAGWATGVGEDAHRRILHLTYRALSGSGIAVKGEHVINPRSGRTALRRTRAWALAATAAASDALSTAFFVMPDEEVALFCTTAADIGGILADGEGALSGYGTLPPEFSKAINNTPGRSPM